MTPHAFLLLVAVFVGLLALAGVVTLTRRLDRAERRRVYETECLVKSLQALEQQNLLLADRIQALTEVRSSIGKILSTAAARRQAAATEEEQQATQVPTGPRVLH